MTAPLDIEAIERVWAAANHGPWRTEVRHWEPGKVKLYAVNDPQLHDSWLLELSEGDLNYQNNLAAIAAAPTHVEMLLAEVKRLRAVVPLKMYVWHPDFLADYTVGMIAVLARTREEAVDLAVAKYEYSSADTRAELEQTEPAVLDEPGAEYVWGGG